MRNAILGGLLVVGLWLLAGSAAGGREGVPATGAFAADAVGQELVTLASPAGENRQMLTIVDPRARTICVYHVDTATGVIALKSVRNIHWDLQMLDYNGANPLPAELRAMFGQK